MKARARNEKQSNRAAGKWEYDAIAYEPWTKYNSNLNFEKEQTMDRTNWRGPKPQKRRAEGLNWNATRAAAQIIIIMNNNDNNQ